VTFVRDGARIQKRARERPQPDRRQRAASPATGDKRSGSCRRLINRAPSLLNKKADKMSAPPSRAVTVSWGWGLGLLVGLGVCCGGEEKRFPALPPDVRKGFAFPLGCLSALRLRLKIGRRHSLKSLTRDRPERQSLSAHQTAEPLTQTA
jgi:hypothetical protein